MQLNFSKFFQPNFPQKSVLSLSNAIVGASVLSMGYCFQQVIRKKNDSDFVLVLVWNYFSDITGDSLCNNHNIFM